MGGAISRNGQPRKALHTVDSAMINIVEDVNNSGPAPPSMEEAGWLAFKVALHIDVRSGPVEMRKVTMAPSTSLEDFVNEMRSVFKGKVAKTEEVSVCYVDEEADTITLGSETEFRVFLQTAPSPIKVELHVAQALVEPSAPSPHQRGNIVVSSHDSTVIDWTANDTIRHMPVVNTRQEVLECPHPGEGEKIQWKTGKQLGRGASGMVHLAINTVTGRLMAVKRITLHEPNDELLIQLNRELNILKNLRHERIVRYLGCVVEERDGFLSNVDICMEYVSGGSLAQALQQFGAFSESVVKRYTRQIIEGLAFLHSHSIVHRDVKGANVLLTDQGEIKLADFGSCKCLEEFKNSNVPKGTVLWMAPEAFSGKVSTKSDIWSLGCTVIEMATGSYPWSNFSNEAAAMYAIRNTQKPPAIPESLSLEGVSFLQLCFAIKPEDRPSAITLLQHPFMCTYEASVYDSNDPFTGSFNESLLRGSTAVASMLSVSTEAKSPPANEACPSFHDYAKLRPSSAPPVRAPKLYLDSIPVKLMDTYLSNKI